MNIQTARAAVSANITTIRYGLEAAAIAFIAWSTWSHFLSHSIPTIPTIAAPSEQLAKVPQQAIAPPKVIVYAPVAKKDTDLPKAIQDDPQKYVLGSVKLPNDTHTHTATPVFDATTGKTDIYVSTDPYPWLASEKRYEVRLSYGFRGMDRVDRIGRLSVTGDFVQTKALHFGGTASLDSDRAWFAGVSVAYQLQ